MSGWAQRQAEEAERREAERDDAEDAVSRVETLLEDQRAYCSGAGLDVPSWVGSVQRALDGP